MTKLVVHLIPHTHWDREWYLTEAHFGGRLAVALDQLLDLLERDPALRWHLDGQAILIDDYLRRRPAALPRVKAAVGGGQLVIGPWYVLADEIIPTGESLIRNLSLGRDVGRRLGGLGRTLYGPDAFGHPATGPRLAAEFDLAGGVVWRGVDPKTIGHRDLFWWRGDATQLLTLHLPGPGYEFGVDLLGRPELLAIRWREIREQATARAATPHLAVLIGADHHGPSERLLDLPSRLASLDPDASFRFSTFEEFFAAVGEPSAATLSGELRRAGRHTWVLQGVHGTRSRLKRIHGAAELCLRRLAEPAAALAGLEMGTLEDAWRRLIESQFHDTLAGSCADEVALEQTVRLRAVRQAAESEFSRAVARLVGHDPDQAREQPDQTGPKLVIWNPVARRRSGLVIVASTWFESDVLVGPIGQRHPRQGKGRQPFAIVTGGGDTLPLQHLAVRSGTERVDAARHYPDLDQVTRVWTALPATWLAGLAATVHDVAIGGEGRPTVDCDRVVVGDRSARNNQVEVVVDRRGRLTVTDLLRGENYPGIGALEWLDDRGDCYTPDLGRRRGVMEPVEVEPIAHGPLLGAIAVRWRLADGAETITGRTVAVVHAGCATVRIRIDLDNNARHHRLRWLVPGPRARSVTVGAGHGVLRRSPGTLDRSWSDEAGLPTDPAHRFVAAARAHRGLALFAPGFFEYQYTDRGVVALTLLRAVGELSRGDLSTRRGHAAWPVATPEAQEPGRHTVALGVRPIDQTTLANPAELIEAWEDVFLPPVGVWHRQTLPLVGSSGLELEGKGLAFEAVTAARAGDGLIVRAINVCASAVQGAWRCPWPVAAADRVRADETKLVSLVPDGRLVRFSAQPGELVSLWIRPGVEPLGY